MHCRFCLGNRLNVVGEAAVQPYIGGDGSTRVTSPTQVDSPLEELRRILGEEVCIEFVGDEKIDTRNNPIGQMEMELTEKAGSIPPIIPFSFPIREKAPEISILPVGGGDTDSIMSTSVSFIRGSKSLMWPQA